LITDPEETARRVRAARAYAGLTRAELAQRVSLTDKQLKLVESGHRRTTSREELLELGHACGVPDAFMDVGFQGAQDVYKQMTRILAVVLSQNFPAMLAEADRVGVDLSQAGEADATPRPPAGQPDGRPRAAPRG
jgi:transcriptional regulator with XRE-family HTH domain